MRGLVLTAAALVGLSACSDERPATETSGTETTTILGDGGDGDGDRDRDRDRDGYGYRHGDRDRHGHGDGYRDRDGRPHFRSLRASSRRRRPVRGRGRRRCLHRPGPRSAGGFARGRAPAPDRGASGSWQRSADARSDGSVPRGLPARPSRQRLPHGAAPGRPALRSLRAACPARRWAARQTTAPASRPCRCGSSTRVL